MSERTISASPTQRRFVDRSMVQLTLARFKGFIREPEAVFWTFVFPVLMAAGLGLAFRQRGPDRPHIGVVLNSAASPIVASLKSDSTLIAEPYQDSAAAKALRTGKIALL